MIASCSGLVTKFEIPIGHVGLRPLLFEAHDICSQVMEGYCEAANP